jgi:N-acetyltransferase
MIAGVEVWPGIARRLQGRGVAMEPLEPRHEADLLEAAADERIWRWLGPYPAQSLESFHEWMSEALRASEAGVECAFATVELASGRAVGSSRYLTLAPADQRLEIGWTWLTPRVWRTGINAEAKLLMLEHAFERLGCVRVEFKTDARNAQSRGALTKLGAQFEGIFRKHRLVPGVGRRDSAYFSIVDDDWPAVRVALEERLAA